MSQFVKSKSAAVTGTHWAVASPADREISLIFLRLEFPTGMDLHAEYNIAMVQERNDDHNSVAVREINAHSWGVCCCVESVVKQRLPSRRNQSTCAKTLDTTALSEIPAQAPHQAESRTHHTGSETWFDCPCRREPLG
jgi:hypothetical protein